MTFVMNLCEQHSFFMDIDVPNGQRPISYMKQPEVMCGRQIDDLANNRPRNMRIKYAQRSSAFHMELPLLKQSHWRPYQNGILVILMNTSNNKHVCVILMSKQGCLDFLCPIHRIFHDIFKFTFVKNKHFRICSVCKKRAKKHDGKNSDVQ